MGIAILKYSIEIVSSKTQPMKIKSSILFTLLLLLLSQINTAQEKPEIVAGDVVELIAPIAVQEDANKNLLVGYQSATATANSANNVPFLEEGYLFKVLMIDTNNSTVELMALDFEEKSSWLFFSERNNNSIKKRNQYNDKIYTVALDDFKKFAELYESKKISRLSLGILTLPFKARISGENIGFDTDFNFNSTASINFRIAKQSTFSFQFGAGLGAVNLNEANTNYRGTGAIEPQDVRTLTLLSGIMFSHQSVQVGIYAGFDYINNQAQYDWHDNGNLWVGLGIGVNVFNKSNQQGNPDQN